MPQFEEKFGGFLTVFRRDIVTEDYLRELGLNERQIKAVKYVREKGRITNTEYRRLNAVFKRTTTKDLTKLTNQSIVEQVGTTGKGTEYILMGQRGHNGVTKGSRE